MADPIVILELVAPGVLDEDLVGLPDVLEGKGYTSRPSLQRQMTRGQLDVARASLIAGRLPFVMGGLSALRRIVPEPLDYLNAPAEVVRRRIWPSTLGAVSSALDRGDPPLFVKPRGRAKSFTGRVVTAPDDLLGIRVRSPRSPVWCSEVVEFRTEHRVFVLRGEIIAVRQYEGEQSDLDAQSAEQTIAPIRSALPDGCAVDLGTLATGEVVLVEANDGFSLGRYGLAADLYAEVLLARWAQLTAR